MKLNLIRNATLRVTYHNTVILIDPFLAPKHSLPSFAGKSPNPLVDLPMSAEKVVDGVDMVIVSHLHTDHFDPAAQELLAKDLPLVCQPNDAERIRAMGFSNVQPLETELEWQRITLKRTLGQHGVGDVLVAMGEVSGFLLTTEGEPTVYWCGDTIWYPEVKKVINANQPDIIITHSSGALWGEYPDPIVMDASQTIALCKAAPNSIVVATHMEALDHGTVSRAELRHKALAEGIPDSQLRIPSNGEMLMF